MRETLLFMNNYLFNFSLNPSDQTNPEATPVAHNAYAAGDRNSTPHGVLRSYHKYSKPVVSGGRIDPKARYSGHRVERTG
ncbi:9727_t:CDS:1, partial [Acaulospora morrowiae]